MELEQDLQKKSDHLKPYMEIGSTTAGFISKKPFWTKEERKKILNHYRTTSKQVQKCFPLIDTPLENAVSFDLDNWKQDFTVGIIENLAKLIPYIAIYLPKWLHQVNILILKSFCDVTHRTPSPSLL